MFNLKNQNDICINLSGLITYDRSAGKYGLLCDGVITKINKWSTTITPQELHFDKPFLKRFNSIFKSEWAYTYNFLGFSDSKTELRHLRKFLKKIRYIK